MEKQIPEITGTLFIVLFIHSFFFYFLFSIFFTYSIIVWNWTKF